MPSFENGTLLLFGVDPRPNLERAFVVTVTGGLKGLMGLIGSKLKHLRKNRLRRRAPGSLIDTGSGALIAALMKSEAWIYALDPTEAIRRAAVGDLR